MINYLASILGFLIFSAIVVGGTVSIIFYKELKIVFYKEESKKNTISSCFYSNSINNYFAPEAYKLYLINKLVDQDKFFGEISHLFKVYSAYESDKALNSPCLISKNELSKDFILLNEYSQAPLKNIVCNKPSPSFYYNGAAA